MAGLEIASGAAAGLMLGVLGTAIDPWGTPRFPRPTRIPPNGMLKSAIERIRKSPTNQADLLAIQPSNSSSKRNSLNRAVTFRVQAPRGLTEEHCACVIIAYTAWRPVQQR